MLTRREAIKTASLAAGALAFAPSVLRAESSGVNSSDATYPFKVPELGYDYDALEPYIDAQTMHLHHDHHHGAYVENLNRAIAQTPEPIKKLSIEELLLNLENVPEKIRPTVRNNAGGHYSHSLFWKVINWDQVAQRFAAATV
jgi:superoxide dismutase, Fe-Mn family